jgi:hypothetical protein
MTQLGPGLRQLSLQMGALGVSEISSQLRFEVLDALS